MTDSIGYTMKYLEMTYLRLLRGKLAPGAEAEVLSLFHGDDAPYQARSLRDHLLHALEGYALAKRTPKVVVHFDVEYPASIFGGKRDNFLFLPKEKVSALCFDGHFGIHRVLETGVDPVRTVRRSGKPRYLEDQRTASCKHKTKERVPMGNRTCGWQFVLDPMNQVCLGAREHLENENMAEKADIVAGVMSMEQVEPDLLIHDDCCRFEKYKQKRNLEAFSSIKFFCIDMFHQKNHKCSKKCWTRAETRRLKHVRTNTAEMFNSWMRRLNFFLNHLRVSSHRFWVYEAIAFWNENEAGKVEHFTRRSTAGQRSRRA